MQKPEPSSIPASPGAYLYRDAQGRVIYVGKARVLRRRVLSYFRREGLSPKTRAMIGRARSVEFITTTTEKEALLLESSLIKKHRPHYNVALRDDKQYFLFRMDLKAAFPRLEIVRRPRRDGARYFGPFTSALAARDTWKLLHRTFPLRRCSDRAMKNRVRPCLYHHMGQCPAPCMGI
ncbi:MAG: GIY-YIG nuclease family protein, partial [Desulfovibrio sp.]|nr:GIY-YIG nuclease family protein [Desulfovibrio sp.]